MVAREATHIATQADDGPVDERRDAIVRVVSEALHELGNTLGAARHYADHAELAIDREVALADLEEIRAALQRATGVARTLGETVRHEGRLRAGVSAPAVVGRVAEQLRRAGVAEVSYVASPAGDPLIVPTVRERALESLVRAMAGGGRPMASVQFEVACWSADGDDEPDGGVAIRVVRDRAHPGDDRDSMNVAVDAGLIGGRVSFHPAAWEWYEAEVRLPGVSVVSRRPEHV